ncbi:amidophosphoribosyltransferase [Thalassococcus sp. CAU 1522]|uniref:Amidophosphoribosyltransferase n=1 Tax=Thalassococcus arenae TaxID=2851652 RepID=A0ABS6N9Q4_9RHOB|nr:amidophosphoribosyltransferase [Thalassococcus arenae]
MPERGLILLGTFGKDSAPQALVRLPDGATRAIAVGDAVNGKIVLAIETGRLALRVGDMAEWMEPPAFR